jgi:hypothetical protein
LDQITETVEVQKENILLPPESKISDITQEIEENNIKKTLDGYRTKNNGDIDGDILMDDKFW